MLNTLIIAFIILAICTMMILLFMIIRKDEQIALKNIEIEKSKSKEMEAYNSMMAFKIYYDMMENNKDVYK